MVIGFTFNIRRTASGMDAAEQSELEFDSPYTVDQIKKAFEEMGYTVMLIEADANAFTVLSQNRDKIDIVFNIAEGVHGDARESQIPLYCEVLKIPYTLSGPTTNALALDKTYTKMLLRGEGVLVPRSVVVREALTELSFGLNYPLIVKPNKEGASKGIFERNVVTDAESMEERVRFMSDNFKTEVIVEEYIEGREVIVSFLGTPPKILPVYEQKFDFLPQGMHGFLSYETRWVYQEQLPDPKMAYNCPADLGTDQLEDLTKTSLRIIQILNLKDCAQLDFRLSGNDGKFYFLEVNPLPSFNPDEKEMGHAIASARAAGIDFKTFLKEILVSACKRYGMREPY